MVQHGFAQVEYVLDDEPVDREHGYLLSRPPVDFLALEAEVEPGPRDEVDGLPDVDPGREARVVGPREGQDVLARHLQGLVDFDLEG